MALVALMAFAVLIAPAAAAGQTPRELRFAGPAAVGDLCASLLDLRRSAEEQGRLDFAAEVAAAEAEGTAVLTARIWPGSAYAVGRINFSGHSGINDSTLRRALAVSERALLDISRLRRGLARINDIGVFEPLSLADVHIVRRDDGVTADLSIPLRERKRRWWSVSGPMLPGVGAWQASLASRLPPWGLGVLEAATYFISLNVTGFARPFLALQRPLIPGQEWLSGFAVSPALSSQEMLMHYGRSHLAPRILTLIDGQRYDPLTIPVASAAPAAPQPLVCEPVKPRLWWLRRGASTAASLALGTLIP
jgi:hypothetical protein